VNSWPSGPWGGGSDGPSLHAAAERMAARATASASVESGPGRILMARTVPGQARAMAVPVCRAISCSTRLGSHGFGRYAEQPAAMALRPTAP
jgi:hypothetical protein